MIERGPKNIATRRLDHVDPFILFEHFVTDAQGEDREVHGTVARP